MSQNSVDEDRLNQSLRKFLKQVGVTSQRAIEEAARQATAAGKPGPLKVRMVLTSADGALSHTVEGDIDLG
ncbi:MAG: DUF6494 family protein [Hyphomicrobiaceae bacterium]